MHVGDEAATYGEDCLYLNVYIPLDSSINSSNINNSLSQMSLPVMVWIHGGGYTIGAGSQYPGTSLAAQGVVLVTINYRLDVFGFTSTEDDVMPGNYGMLDQIAALRWVKDNIAGFGGDPNMVTVFGESAGASSVSLLMLSPLAKGLFHRGIMESGSSLCPWATKQPANRVSPAMVARLVGAGVGCDDLTNSSNLLACLQNVDSQKLLNTSLTVTQAVQDLLIYSPRVETSFGFLPDLPVNLLIRREFNHVDTLSGFNGDETGGYLPFAGVSSIEAARHVMDLLLRQFTDVDKGLIRRLLESHYLANTTSGLANTTSGGDSDLLQQHLLDSLDDFMYAGPAVEELHHVALGAQEKSHYLYEFRYRPAFHRDPQWTQAFHADELGYVFGIQQPSFVDHNGSPPDKDDILVSQQMMQRWANFAKTGVPSSSGQSDTVWNVYSPTSPEYLEISPNSTMRTWSRPTLQRLYKNIINIMAFGDDSTGVDLIIG